MSYLTEKELAFLEALKKDQAIRGNESFAELLWHSVFLSKEKLRKELEDSFEGDYQKLFDNSDLILLSIDGLIIGKYKDTFWGTGSEGEVFGMGREIQNVVLQIIDAYYGDVLDPEEKPSIVEYFRKYLDLNYDEYIQSYRDFCKKVGLEYEENWDLMNEQSENFEKELLLLK